MHMNMKKIALSTSLIAATFLTASISLAQAEQPVKTTSKAPAKVSYTEDQFLTAFSGKMKNVVAVSYTHLDVYKRQVQL